VATKNAKQQKVKKQIVKARPKRKSSSNMAAKFVVAAGSFTGPFGWSDDANPDQIPPFVAILAILMGLVVLGFIMYVGAVLLGEAWHHYL
jgi:hypothetical protein